MPQPLDLLIRNARLPRSAGTTDLAIRDGRIVAAAEASAGARETIDAAGALVTPALVEPHIHLDAVLTVGQPRYNQTGSLFEGIAIWGERVKDLTVEDVKQRVRTVLRWQLASGVLYVRSHVDVCDPELTALRALLELRDEVAGQMTLQLVAFPQQGILSFPDGEALMRKAVEMGADCVGAIPHFELTREYGVRSVEFALGARRRARPAGRRPLRRDRRRALALPGGDGRRDDPARAPGAGHGQPHHGDALVQQRLRLPPDQQRQAGGAAHGHQPARQLDAPGPLRHLPDPARPHPDQGAAGGRRQRLHRPRLDHGPLVPARLRRPALLRLGAGPLRPDVRLRGASARCST